MSNSVIKKKRVSKKKKIAWRKHVDISDVDAFLEDQRLEERIGKPLHLFKDEELFYVDVKPTTQAVTSKKLKRLKLQAPPKCFSMLQPHTNVPDPIAKRNRVRTKEERKNDLLKRKEEHMRLNGILKMKEKQALEDRKFSLEKKQKEKEDKCNDIWNEGNDNEMAWIDEKTIRHNNEATGKVHKQLSVTLKGKRSILPTIEAPHPGTSYNPSFEDHQDLLNKIAEKEQKIIKEEAHLNRVTRNMFSKVTEAERDSTYLKEMSEGLPVKNNPAEENDENSDSEYQALNPPVLNKKKTLQQRRKQKEQAEQERQRKLAKIEKKKVADIYKLRFLSKELEEQEKKTKMLQEKRKVVQEKKQGEAQRLGPNKFEEPDVEFNMGIDITGNLRTMKKEGNILSDRFRSLQKRNILDVGLKRNMKRSKIKRFQMPGHKSDWKITVARVKTK